MPSEKECYAAGFLRCCWPRCAAKKLRACIDDYTDIHVNLSSVRGQLACTPTS